MDTDTILTKNSNNNNKWLEIINAFPDDLFILDAKGVVKYGHEACLTAKPSWIADLGQIFIGDAFPAPVADKFSKAINNLKNGDKIVSLEFYVSENEARCDYEARLFHLGIGINEIGLIIRDITDMKLAENRLRYLSMHDALTGLYNVAYFDEEMHRLENNRDLPLGLIVCDIDGLKLVNDTFGHKAGDVLLIRAGETLKNSTRKNDVVARIGGDEFAVLLSNADSETVARVCDRINKHMKDTNASSRDIHLNMSIGYSIRQDDNTSMEDFFKDADMKMYQNKIRHRPEIMKDMVENMIANLKENKIQDGYIPNNVLSSGDEEVSERERLIIALKRLLNDSSTKN